MERSQHQSSYLAGSVACGEKPMQKQVFWQDQRPNRAPTLEQSVLETLQPMEKTHAGGVCEELKPVGRTHNGEFLEGFSPVGGTPSQSRG